MKDKTNEPVKVNDNIIILYMKDEPEYTGRFGAVSKIETDEFGILIYGSWGRYPIIPEYDSYMKI